MTSPRVVGALSVLCVVVLAGCATTTPVKLRHPQTGHVVQCGPYAVGRIGPEWAAVAVAQERGCIEDYQRQGYGRVPE